MAGWKREKREEKKGTRAAGGREKGRDMLCDGRLVGLMEEIDMLRSGTGARNGYIQRIHEAWEGEDWRAQRITVRLQERHTDVGDDTTVFMFGALLENQARWTPDIHPGCSLVGHLHKGGGHEELDYTIT